MEEKNFFFDLELKMFFYVRLSCIVQKGIIDFNVNMKRCDQPHCKICMDKVQNGGAGRRRQACPNVKRYTDGPIHICVAFRTVQANLVSRKRCHLLSDAIQKNPHGLPLVWGLRRSKRARPLPFAYPLEFHCVDVKFDRRFLFESLFFPPKKK